MRLKKKKGVGIMSEGLKDKWEQLESRLVKQGSGMKKEGVGGVGPSILSSGLGNISFTLPIDYKPEFASPDRWSYPVSLQEQLKYWRLFYAVDPIVGATIETYTQMCLSDYQLVGKGVEGSVKNLFETMLNELNFVFMLQSMMVEFLVCGEVIVNLIFDSEEGIFTDWIMLKPEDIEVHDLGMIGLENIIVYKPRKEVKEQCRKAINALVAAGYNDVNLGKGFLNDMLTKDSVVLEPLSSVWVPRLLHVYDLRGTSLLTRLWRIMMFEDAVFNATIQTAKRHAAPVKVVTMGDLGAGLLPTQEQVDKLLQNLAAAEVDPQAWVFVPPGTRFEAWGTTDRIMSISKEYEIIERLKLLALGVSRDFIAGTSTFASAQASLQVFMSRLLTFRVFFEEVFVKPKLFLTIAKANGLLAPRPVDVDHRVKTNKGREYIVPEIRWSKTLKPVVNKDLLDAYDMIVNTFNGKISSRTLYDAVGLSWEDEIRKVLQESKIIELLEKKKEEKEDIGGGSFGKSMGLGGLEEIAPMPEVSPTAEEVTMHASKVMNDLMKGKSDDELKELMEKYGLYGKKDSNESVDDRRFLVGVEPKRKFFVNELSEKEVKDRLMNKNSIFWKKEVGDYE